MGGSGNPWYHRDVLRTRGIRLTPPDTPPLGGPHRIPGGTLAEHESSLAVLVDFENMARPGAKGRNDFDIHWS
jgi:hypothetical protein